MPPLHSPLSAAAVKAPGGHGRCSPAPRRPLELHAGEPVTVEVPRERIQSRTPISGASERRHSRHVPGRSSSLLLREDVTRSRELFIFGARAQRWERAARLCHFVGQIRNCQSAGSACLPPGQIARHREGSVTIRRDFRNRLSPSEQLCLDDRCFTGERRPMLHTIGGNVKLRLEIGYPCRNLRLLGLKLQSGEVCVVDVLPQSVERRPDTCLGFGQLRALDSAPAAQRRIEIRCLASTCAS